jgi:hypothetical protein
MSIRTSVSGGVAIFVPTGFVRVNKGLILPNGICRGIGAALSGKAPSAQFNGTARSFTVGPQAGPFLAWRLYQLGFWRRALRRRDGFFFFQASYIARETQNSTKTGMNHVL